MVCVACLQWVRQTSSHSYVCTFVYCALADEKVEDSDDVLKALEAVVDRKQCVHVRISACLCNTLYICYMYVRMCTMM